MRARVQTFLFSLFLRWPLLLPLFSFSIFHGLIFFQSMQCLCVRLVFVCLWASTGWRDLAGSFHELTIHELARACGSHGIEENKAKPRLSHAAGVYVRHGCQVCVTSLCSWANYVAAPNHPHA